MSCAHLDLAMVEQELIRHFGNVSATAKVLNVPITDLRRLTLVVPRLIEASLEAGERRCDRAEQILDEALESSDVRRRDTAAAFILRSNLQARKRGWSSPQTAVEVDVAKPQRPIVYTWADGTVIARVWPPEPGLIEGEASTATDESGRSLLQSSEETGESGTASDRDPPSAR
jgi:hypothetical protein